MVEAVPMQTREYLEDTYRFESEATVVRVGQDERGPYCVLDRSIFHPQGGGQPADRGELTPRDGAVAGGLAVVHVGCVGAEVRHYLAGTEASLHEGARLRLRVDPETRRACARLHTAGHLLAALVEAAWPGLVATKGYHFPDGAYVEFLGSLAPGDQGDAALHALDARLREAVTRGGAVVAYCDGVPSAGGAMPHRVVAIEGFRALPCGGTHVRDLRELRKVELVRIKRQRQAVRISYRVA